jgi:hypothetical protein
MMKATIWLLGIWFVTLAIEVPVGTIFACTPPVAPGNPCSSVPSYAGALAIEGTFLILMVLFIIYGRRGKTWSFVGATVIGAVHAVLSYEIYFFPLILPVAIAAWLTLSPALVAIAGAASVIELRR